MGSDLKATVELPLFHGISDQDRAALLGCLKTYSRSYKKGAYIHLEQDHVQDVGIVCSGLVHMLKEDVWGRLTLLAYMGPGELFGETSALCGERAGHVSFLAAEDTEVLFLPLDHVLTPCKKQCDFHAVVSRNLCGMLGENNLKLMEKIEIAAKGSLREKILAYLSIQSQRQGSKYITVPLNRTEMANFLHANRSAMSRELTSMQADGLIEFDGNTFVLK